MKIAFAYGAWSVGDRHFDYDNLFTSSRGLTGSEISLFSFAKEMSKRGHEVSIYSKHKPFSGKWSGLDVRPIEELTHESTRDTDAVCAWNEPDLLRQVNPRCVRLFNQQLNDFGYCVPDFDDFVDVYTSPSAAHQAYLLQFIPKPEKWEVLPNGCDSSQYRDDVRVPGRVIYASSPDRGLHLLLQAWPKIRREVPEATLRVFYNFESWFRSMSGATNHENADVRECAYRALYIKEAMERLKGHGVEHLHSISREQMALEMSEADVLAYPCDTVRYTEGFSVTTMEACASGVLPVISSVDSLGSIYGSVVPMVPAPAGDHLEEFADLVIRGLKDRDWRDRTTIATKHFSSQFEWSVLSEKLESILRARMFQK